MVPFFVKSYNNGDATNNEENVPIAIPINIANMNPLIESPPKMKIHNTIRNVLNDVLMVRDKVVLVDELMIS